jgi:hypothetical protein
MAQATAPLFLYPKQSFCPYAEVRHLVSARAALQQCIRRRGQAPRGSQDLGGNGNRGAERVATPAKVNTADLLGVGRVTLMVKT